MHHSGSCCQPILVDILAAAAAAAVTMVAAVELLSQRVVVVTPSTRSVQVTTLCLQSKRGGAGRAANCLHQLTKVMEQHQT